MKSANIDPMSQEKRHVEIVSWEAWVTPHVWYPGWQASMDGVATDILRANYLFRAVAVPKGQHEIVFVYRPIWSFASLLISVAAWLGLLFTSFWYKRRMADAL